LASDDPAYSSSILSPFAAAMNAVYSLAKNLFRPPVFLQRVSAIEQKPEERYLYQRLTTDASSATHETQRTSPRLSTVRYSREQLLSYRAEITPFRQRAQEEIDKQILTLSSTALGLSLTFYKDYISKAVPAYGFLLYIAWAAWIVALGSVLLSMYSSASLVQVTRNAIDNALRNPKLTRVISGLSGVPQKGENESSQLPWHEADFGTTGRGLRIALRVLNVLSLLGFFVGILAFALIFLLNLKIH
jgi:hypothetical protein